MTFLIRRKKVNKMGTDVASVKSGSRKPQELPSNGFCFPPRSSARPPLLSDGYITFS